jgi:hypothetical protein
MLATLGVGVPLPRHLLVMSLVLTHSTGMRAWTTFVQM